MAWPGFIRQKVTMIKMSITMYKNARTREYELMCENCGYKTVINEWDFYGDSMKNFVCPQCKKIESEWGLRQNKKHTNKVLSIEGICYVGMWM